MIRTLLRRRGSDVAVNDEPACITRLGGWVHGCDVAATTIPVREGNCRRLSAIPAGSGHKARVYSSGWECLSPRAGDLC